MTPLSGAWKGLIVAIGNSLVIAVFLAISERDAEVVAMVSFIAALPAGATGLVAGTLVGAMPKHPVGWRLLTLFVPAIGLVAVLGTEFAMGRYILPSSIPTLVACAVLEKWTRWTPVADALPCARIRA